MSSLHKTCAECKERFIFHVCTARFCSRECASKARNRKR